MKICLTSLSRRYSILFPSLVALTTLGMGVLLMAFYLGGELRGNLDWSILPSAQYEIPEALTARGFEPLYIHRGQSGWDGQFYYYIANDITAQTDAKYKVEMSPYRYQRIGVSLLAKAAGALMGYDYVPVSVFYFTSLFLVVAASFFFARFLERRGYSPYLALLWSLAAGTQMTVLHGLPDAGADALLLMALAALFSGRLWLYAASMALAVLSREIYIVVAIGLALAEAWRFRKTLLSRHAVYALLPVALPVAVFGAWQLYLKIHFADMPSIDVFKEGLLAFTPLASLGFFTLRALIGEHPIFGGGMPAFREAAGLFSFIVLLMLSFGFLFALLRRLWGSERDREAQLYAGLGGAFLVIFSTYLFFGDTVMRHHTGFLKTVSICFAVVLFCHIGLRKKVSREILAVILVCLLLPQPTLWLRVMTPPSTQMQYGTIYEKDADISAFPFFAPCLPQLDYALEIAGKEDFYKNNFFARLVGQDEYFVFSIRVKNNSTQTWTTAHTTGSVKLINYWRWEANNQLIPAFTWPTLLQSPLGPGEERLLPVVVRVPPIKGTKKLTFTMAQQGCGDFFNPKDSHALDMIWEK